MKRGQILVDLAKKRYKEQVDSEDNQPQATDETATLQIDGSLTKNQADNLSWTSSSSSSSNEEDEYIPDPDDVSETDEEQPLEYTFLVPVVPTEQEIDNRPIAVDSQLEVIGDDLMLLDGETYTIMENVEIQVTNCNQDLLTYPDDVENDNGVEFAIDNSPLVADVPAQEAQETNCDQTIQPCPKNVNDNGVESDIDESRLMQDVDDQEDVSPQCDL
ncbi:hypothetical protein LSTR_LSTR008818 [Laodelphax striatellus]|uniref:Uncharacterized protein n=1 Tax=Laodelphax striatellus TaxID=195883 RepID=A0A482X4E7_LAOST|nr:hypothetical protein LSTR_LSTR008818 [Laodelphax striatellus]